MMAGGPRAATMMATTRRRRHQSSASSSSSSISSRVHSGRQQQQQKSRAIISGMTDSSYSSPALPEQSPFFVETATTPHLLALSTITDSSNSANKDVTVFHYEISDDASSLAAGLQTTAARASASGGMMRQHFQTFGSMQQTPRFDVADQVAIANHEPVITNSSSVQILPIPVIGASFIVVCLAVLVVSLRRHCEDAEGKHISWLRTKPRAITEITLTPSGPGHVRIVVGNYEYVCSQAPMASNDSSSQKMSKNRLSKPNSLLSFGTGILNRGASFLGGSKSSRLNDSAAGAGLISLTTIENTAATSNDASSHRLDYSASFSNKLRAFRKATFSSGGPAAEVVDVSDVDVDHSELGESTFWGHSGYQHPALVSSQLDQLDTSYWSYEKKQRRPSASSSPSVTAPVTFHIATESMDCSENMNNNDSEATTSITVALPRQSSVEGRRSPRLGQQQHPQQSIDSRTSVLSATSTTSGVSQLMVPRESPMLQRQQSLRLRSDESESFIPRGKTHTGLLSLSRLHNMIQSRIDREHTQPPIHQLNRKHSVLQPHHPVYSMATSSSAAPGYTPPQHQASSSSSSSNIIASNRPHTISIQPPSAPQSTVNIFSSSAT